MENIIVNSFFTEIFVFPCVYELIIYIYIFSCIEAALHKKKIGSALDSNHRLSLDALPALLNSSSEL